MHTQASAVISQQSRRPGLAVFAVLLGAFLVNFQIRLYGIGQVDLRGYLGLGVDEAAWLNTFATAPQMLIAPCIPWVASIFGVRRLLFYPGLIYGLVSLAIPFTHGFAGLALLHLLHGLLLGLFVPATLLVVLKSLPPRWWLAGVAIYALRPGFAANAGVSLVDFYVQHMGWEFLYWQDALIAPVIAGAAMYAAPQKAPEMTSLPDADWGGMLLFGAGLAMIFVGLDQGNRLDWFASGTVTACLAGGLTLMLAFFVNEALVRDPWAAVSVISKRSNAVLLLISVLYLLTGLSNTLLIPSYLASISGLRPEQIGSELLLWSCLPLIVATPLAIWALHRLDGRYVLLVGLGCFATAALIGTRLTSEWNGETFHLMAALQGAGHILTFLPVISMSLAHANPRRATAFAAYIQVVRLLGGEWAQSMMVTFLRKREQLYSYLIGLNVKSGDPMTISALKDAANHLPTSGDANNQAVLLLGQRVARQANVISYIDGFWLTLIAAIIGICLLALVSRPSRGPLSPV